MTHWSLTWGPRSPLVWVWHNGGRTGDLRETRRSDGTWTLSGPECWPEISPLPSSRRDGGCWTVIWSWWVGTLRSVSLTECVAWQVVSSLRWRSVREIDWSDRDNPVQCSGGQWWTMETILQGEYGPPLDYSFRNISSLSSLPTKYPRQSLRKQRRSPSGRWVPWLRSGNPDLLIFDELPGTTVTSSGCPTTTWWTPTDSTSWLWTWWSVRRTSPGWTSPSMT